MQEKHLYEYAVIRVVPRVEREEFINVGLILFCKRKNYIKTRYIIDEKKLACFTSELDIQALRENLHAFDLICRENENRSYIATLEVPERFRWLTAVRSASIQTSRPHPGFTRNLDATFEKLFQELVL